jgi:hypothetical protein
MAPVVNGLGPDCRVQVGVEARPRLHLARRTWGAGLDLAAHIAEPLHFCYPTPNATAAPPSTHPVTAIRLAPDGRVLALAYADGAVAVMALQPNPGPDGGPNGRQGPKHQGSLQMREG